MKRVIDTNFWTDDKVVDMFSPEDKLFFLYLLTNPHTTQLGIYPLNKKIMAFEIGYSIEAIDVLLDRFENKYHIILRSRKTSEIAIMNYLRHSIVKGGKPMEDLLVAEASRVTDKSLIRAIHDYLIKFPNLNESVKAILPLIYINNNKGNENVYVNDNENENVVSYHESYDDSYHDSSKSAQKSSKAFIPPTLTEVTQYKNERQSPVDPEAFIDFYQSKGWMVGKNKMKDWKAAFRNWERDRKPSSQGKKSINQQNVEAWAKYLGKENTDDKRTDEELLSLEESDFFIH